MINSITGRVVRLPNIENVRRFINHSSSSGIQQRYLHLPLLRAAVSHSITSKDYFCIQERTFVTTANGKVAKRRIRKKAPSHPQDDDEAVIDLSFGLSNLNLRDTNKVAQTQVPTRVGVRSRFLAHGIDLVSVFSKVFSNKSLNNDNNNESSTPPIAHRFGQNSLMIQLSSHSSITSINNNNNTSNNTTTNQNTTAPSYAIVFRYGSVVLFNVSQEDERQLVNLIKQYSSEPLSGGFEQREDFHVAIEPDFEEEDNESKCVSGDSAVVNQLDMNNVAVIGTIMAQSVALDYYNITVEELLGTLEKINKTVKDTGKITDLEKETLFKVVAQNNTLLNDILTKLRVKERSDTAWKYVQYDKVYEAMKEEFELDSRFSHTVFKLNLIQQNSKFFLEVLQNQKSTSLEMIIIVLIAFECGLMCLDMSGMGNVLFEKFFT